MSIFSRRRSTKRLYFVDESGQDTAGQIFIVAISVVERDHQDIEQTCLEFEKASGKGKSKWHRTPNERRLTYMRLMIEDSRFSGALCYLAFTNIERKEFDKYTVAAIAKTVEHTRDDEQSNAEIYIDGLTNKKQAEYSKQLRASGIHHARVHRATDQGYTLIRLADALAGLARDAIEDADSEAARIFQRGKRNGMIVEVK